MDDVERAFREAHGQAVATLVRVFGDIALAEDAVQDAFVTAVDRWLRDGVPGDPAGWIVTTARNRAVDVVRRNRRGRELTRGIASDRLRRLRTRTRLTGCSPSFQVMRFRQRDLPASLRGGVLRGLGSVCRWREHEDH